jgi:DNA polymerase-3 subunit epsilon
MPLWHLGRMLAFDTETTGVDPDEARIVTACAARIWGDGSLSADVQNWLVNPGVPIPPGATAIHGITDEKAAAGRPPAEAVLEIAAELESTWEQGFPVIGHNVAYDLTVLDRELRRHGHPPLEVTGPVIDTLVLDRQVVRFRRGQGARKLDALCAAYDVRLDGAHDAAFDALASARIAWRIAQRYPEIAGMSLAELHEAQVGWAGDQAASLQAYFRRTNPDAVVDGSWPVRAAAEGVAA